MARICQYLKGHSTAPTPHDQVANFAVIEKCFSPEECQRITALSSSLEPAEGRISSRGENTNGQASDWSTEHQVRKSKVSFLPPGDETDWIYERMQAIVQLVNQKQRYELVGFELFQLASYTEGGHYDWHIDVGSGDESTRKLSITVQLTASTEYEGGGLQFVSDEHAANREQGTAIIFPSFLAHRVQPVTSGTRYSIVAWVHGPAFR